VARPQSGISPLTEALATGARIGFYEVTGRLGAGAMGAVYRARDTRLGRTVALKVLRSADDPEQFATLFAYSPLHNIRSDVAYPATLVTTGDHDDRVVPGHSFKFAAALQAAQAGEAPIIIRIDTDAGHGLGKPVGKLIDERADVLAFLELALG